MARQSYRRPFADGTREMISINSTLNNQPSTINCFNEERHMSERVFYPDTDDVSSTSKAVALSIARFRLMIHVARALLLIRCVIVRKNAPNSGSCADSWYFASG